MIIMIIMINYPGIPFAKRVPTGAIEETAGHFIKFYAISQVTTVSISSI